MIHETDIEKLIYDEATSYFTELFGAAPGSFKSPAGGIESDFLPKDIYSGFEPLPPFLNGATAASQLLDAAAIRRDFPILDERINGKKLIWFDNAATTQKPRCVIERLRYFYEHENSNVHRGAHTLARRTTQAYEQARQKAADFLGATDPNSIVFVRGATEGINLVACAYGDIHISEKDEILVTELEHHANIVPWQLLCQRTGAKLTVVPIDDSGQIIMSAYKQLLSARVKIVAVTHVSNVLGTVTPVEEMIRLAHSVGAVVLVDGAQAAAHLPVNVNALDADFYVFSGHKVFGPTGIGVIWGKPVLLEAMTP